MMWSFDKTYLLVIKLVHDDMSSAGFIYQNSTPLLLLFSAQIAEVCSFACLKVSTLFLQEHWHSFLECIPRFTY